MSVNLHPDNPMVGRAPELSALLALFDEVVAGRGEVVLLSGEPGIGKTRLGHAFATEAASRGAFTLWGRCFDGDWAPPYGPWGEAIGGFARSASPDLISSLVGREGLLSASPLAALVPDLSLGLPAAVELGTDEERVRLHDAVARFFTGLSASRPVVIVLEDLHWADGASIELLRHIVFTTSNIPVMLLLTFRDIELWPQHPFTQLLPSLRQSGKTRSIALKGLTSSDVELLIAGETPTAWSNRLAQTIHSETRGNPFFIEELLRHLEDEVQSTRGGDWTASTELSEISIPEGVRQVVGRRLDRLSDDTQRLLTHASVFTGGFDYIVLPFLTELPDDALLNAIDEALAAKMLEPSRNGLERYDFVHSIVRHALSDTWNPSRRVRLHRRAAEAIAAAYAGREREHAAELAVQYHRSASPHRQAYRTQSKPPDRPVGHTTATALSDSCGSLATSARTLPPSSGQRFSPALRSRKPRRCSPANRH
jgi:predicted ATPase